MPEMSVSFVNGAASEYATKGLCWGFARQMEKTEFGEAYRTANESYLRLTKIAKPVKTKEEAFVLIAKAYGSVDSFFETMEAQREAFGMFGREMIRKRSTFLEGLGCCAAARSSKGWQKKFRHEWAAISS